MVTKEQKANGFYGSAMSRARNPLGIIALFIILVYAVAGIVIVRGDEKFYAAGSHPVVQFFAYFPVLVLLVFTVLVAFCHKNLYGPGDYKDEKLFHFPYEPPAKLGNRRANVATSDPSELPPNQDVKEQLDAAYKDLIQFGFVLLHEAEVIRERTPLRTGLYKIRIWVEAIEGRRQPSEIESVTYRIWDNFSPKNILTTTDKRSQFDLWLNAYGEFPVLATVKTKDGEQRNLQRYLELPGRPPD